MAKKTKSYSQVQATVELEQLGSRGTSAPELSNIGETCTRKRVCSTIIVLLA